MKGNAYVQLRKLLTGNPARKASGTVTAVTGAVASVNVRGTVLDYNMGLFTVSVGDAVIVEGGDVVRRLNGGLLTGTSSFTSPMGS